MNKELFDQVNRVVQAQNEVRQKDDEESRVKLSLEIMRLNDISPLSEDKIMKLRTTYGLISFYWALAEYKHMIEKE